MPTKLLLSCAILLHTAGMSTAGIEPSSLPGVVVDTDAAQFTGQWKRSTHTSPYVGEDYVHDEKQDKGSKSAKFVPSLPKAGLYQVLLAYSAASTRSSATPVTIETAEGQRKVLLDQRRWPGSSKPFASLGTFRFEAGTAGSAVVSTEGTDGYVTVDAMQFLPVAEAVAASGNVRSEGDTLARSAPAAEALQPPVPKQELPKPSPPSRPVREITSMELDGMISEALGDTVVSGPSSDEEFLRRAYMDLLGRQPTPAEIASFSASGGSTSRPDLIDGLLEDDEFGQNWANYWSDTISYRVPPPELTFLNYGPLKAWLAVLLNEGRPWDVVVREIIIASGKVGENAPATFAGFHEGSATRLASETSRIFLGVQIQCAECHDHPFEDWKREQFHQLAAFFARVKAKAPHNDSMKIDVTDAGKGEHHMPDMADPRKKGPPMKPMFFTPDRSLELDATDTERRQALAVWVTSPDNPWFAKAYVNRIWERLLGRGFVDPVDNLAGLEVGRMSDVHNALADSFIASGFDVKKLFRVVMNTQAYQRRLATSNTEGGAPLAAAAVTRIRGDQVFDALVTAIELPNVTPPATAPTAAVRFPPPPKSTRDLVNDAFGFDPSLPNVEVVRTLTQAMWMMNNEQLQAQINAAPDSDTMLSKLLLAEPDDRAAIEQLYQRVLARSPSEAEVEIALRHRTEVQSRGEAFEDLLWALLNSTEFTVKR